MTLVVAQRSTTGIEIVGDIRPTQHERSARKTLRVEPRIRFFDGALKVVALHPALCVGYAGPVAIAQDAIRRLGVDRDADFSVDEVTRFLARRAHGDVEFIVVSLVPTPSIAKVADGSVHAGGDRHFIGDVRAYDIFHRKFAKLQRLSNAMEAVVDSEEAQSVGDLAVTVRTEEEGFRYRMTFEAQSGPVRVGPGGSEVADDEWDTVAGGAYFRVVIPPNLAGVGAIAVYIRQGRLGGLFYPAKTERAIPYRDVDLAGFVQAVRRDHGIELDSRGARMDSGPGRMIELR